MPIELVDRGICADCEHYGGTRPVVGRWSEQCTKAMMSLSLMSELPNHCPHEDAQRGSLVARKLMEK